MLMTQFFKIYFKEIKQKSDEEIQSIISVFRKNVVLKDKTICKFYDFINNLLGINFYAIEVINFSNRSIIVNNLMDVF